MPKGLPRRLIPELITRWSLTGIRQIVVEGRSDQRFLQLLQRETHCEPRLVGFDVCAVEFIEVPGDMLINHGIGGTGAKQRVIAFSREIELMRAQAGFCGIVDVDLDRVLGIDFSSNTLIYTDYGCMPAYAWTIDILHRLLIQFNCESEINSEQKLSGLFSSINAACKAIAAVRVVLAEHPELDLSLHNSDKCLSFNDCEVALDLRKYIEQCKPLRGQLEKTRALVTGAQTAVEHYDSLCILNSHDLFWVLTYVLKELTKHPRRAVDEEIVETSLLGLGLLRPELTSFPMFRALSDWSGEPAA